MRTSTRPNRYGSVRRSIYLVDDWPDIEERREVWASLTGEDSDWLRRQIHQGALGTCDEHPSPDPVEERIAAAQQERVRRRQMALVQRRRRWQLRQERWRQEEEQRRLERERRRLEEEEQREQEAQRLKDAALMEVAADILERYPSLRPWRPWSLTIREKA